MINGDIMPERPSRISRQDFKKRFGINYNKEKYGQKAVRNLRDRKLVSAIDLTKGNEDIMYPITALYSAMRNLPKEIVAQRRAEVMAAIQRLFVREREALAQDKRYIVYFTYFRRAIAQLRRLA
jgi:hypothetical protein